jgi:hypothetical protein
MAEKKPTDEKPDGPLGDSVGLAGWFIGPGVAALAPWFLPLMKADLIGEYQAKPANLCASLLAPAAFFVAAACYRRSSREKRRKHLLANLRHNMAVARVGATFASSLVRRLFACFCLICRDDSACYVPTRQEIAVMKCP